MSNNLAKKDLDREVHKHIYHQRYLSPVIIRDVKLVKLHNIVLDDGDFNEIVHIETNRTVKHFPHFRIAQINRTRLMPGSIKAWHLHYRQDEIWYLSPSDHLLVGLWDVRQNSKTKGQMMRIILGGGASSLLFIPRGVAHGSSVVNHQAAELYVFVNRRFNRQNPDEKRIRWDYWGQDFWQMQKDTPPSKTSPRF